jgi:hypothetical protein
MSTPIHSTERLPKPDEYPILWWSGEQWLGSTSKAVFATGDCWWMAPPPSPEPDEIKQIRCPECHHPFDFNLTKKEIKS